jgi:hypothetical protein
LNLVFLRNALYVKSSKNDVVIAWNGNDNGFEVSLVQSWSNHHESMVVALRAWGELVEPFVLIALAMLVQWTPKDGRGQVPRKEHEESGQPAIAVLA